MCDYSLQHVHSRPAKVGDQLTTRHFGFGTRGFCAHEDENVAVCVLPGTELSFAGEVVLEHHCMMLEQHRFTTTINYKTAIFRQVNKATEIAHHDALEFPNGRVVLLTVLAEGQKATVLQLPASAAKTETLQRAEYHWDNV